MIENEELYWDFDGVSRMWSLKSHERGTICTVSDLVVRQIESGETPREWTLQWAADWAGVPVKDLPEWPVRYIPSDMEQAAKLLAEALANKERREKKRD